VITSPNDSLSGSPFDGYECKRGCRVLIMPGDKIIEIRQGTRDPDGIGFSEITAHDFFHQDCYES
jgi:hypothetical protein